MGEYQLALKKFFIKTVNPSGQDLLCFGIRTVRKKELINLFENYVFILRSSYVHYLLSIIVKQKLHHIIELNNTIDFFILEDNQLNSFLNNTD